MNSVVLPPVGLRLTSQLLSALCYFSINHSLRGRKPLRWLESILIIYFCCRNVNRSSRRLVFPTCWWVGNMAMKMNGETLMTLGPGNCNINLVWFQAMMLLRILTVHHENEYGLLDSLALCGRSPWYIPACLTRSFTMMDRAMPLKASPGLASVG